MESVVRAVFYFLFSKGTKKQSVHLIEKKGEKVNEGGLKRGNSLRQ